MKPVTKVFMVIGALAFCMLIWSVVFNQGGLIGTAWDAVADSVNTKWQSMTGTDGEIVPAFSDAGGGDINNIEDADPNGGGAVGP